jgi:hypothetical protein
MLKTSIALSTAILLAINPAHADSYGIIGVSMNSSELTDPVASSSAQNHDEESNTAYFDIGYFISENMAIEFGYRSFDSSESYTFTGTLSGETELDILKLGIRGITSRDESLYAFGGLGAASITQESTVKTLNTGSSYTVGQKIKSDSVNAYYSIGAGYRFNESISLEASYSDYGKDGDNANSLKPAEKELSEFAIGLNIAF